MSKSKQKLFLLALVTILSTALAVLFLNYDPNKLTQRQELEKAINQAKYLYRMQKERYVDFSKGPCLSDALMSGWVADIVHDPRQSIDDLGQNQCPSFIDGRARHFVELDTEGNFVRAK